jgi:hypothetical protein
MANTTATKTMSKMRYKQLGTSGLKVSQVIVGAMSFGSPDWQSWVLDEEQWVQPAIFYIVAKTSRPDRYPF